MKNHNSQLSTLNSQLIKVAIIDDHKVVAEGFERLINESDDVRVVSKAYSVSGCLDMLKISQPDILLLDISMPDGNGIELCTKIKTLYPKIKILMLTTYNELVTITRALDAGADGYVLKNCLTEEVLEGIRTVASGERFLCKEANETLTNRKQIPMELTRREIELLQLIVKGLTLQELADKMCLGTETIRSYRKNLNFKLNAHNTAQLLRNARTLGLI